MKEKTFALPLIAVFMLYTLLIVGMLVYSFITMNTIRKLKFEVSTQKEIVCMYKTKFYNCKDQLGCFYKED